MDFEWDERKANANLIAHGLSFKTATGVFASSGVTLVETTRSEDRERRFKAIGRLEGQLYTVVFTMRGEVYRLISARGALTSGRSVYMAIVRYRLDPSNPPKMTAEERGRLASMTEDEIERNAIADPDNPPLTDEEAERIRFSRAVRQAREKSGLTQPMFADRYRITLSRLRDWEQGRYNPDSVAAAYIKTINHNPKAVARALDAED